MGENSENPKIDGNKIVRNEKGQIVSGVLNPAGKPVGTLSFKSKWEIFVDKVAKQNNMSTEDIDEQLLAVGFKKAKEGDYSFYRDIHDRVYGKPVQPNEISGKDGTPLTVNIIKYGDTDSTRI